MPDDTFEVTIYGHPATVRVTDHSPRVQAVTQGDPNDCDEGEAESVKWEAATGDDLFDELIHNITDQDALNSVESQILEQMR